MTEGGRRIRRGVALFIVLAALATLIGLGVWQLQRLAWKEALIAERTERLAEPPIALPEDLDPVEPLLQRRVRLTGRFLHGQELFFTARTSNGRVGFHLVTPLELTDGRSLLVDRGWLPPELKELATRPDSRQEGAVTLLAWLKPGGWRGSPWFEPANEPDKRLWLWPDLAEMAHVAGLARPVTVVYAEALGEGQGVGFPLPVTPSADIRNDHLQYAITWFALAGALLVIFVLYLRRSRQERESSTGPRQEDRSPS